MYSVKVEEIIAELKQNANSKNVEGMAKFGINPEKALGVKVPILRTISKKYKNNHELALELWDTEIHEARVLASMVDDPIKVTEEQMEAWVSAFDSWDVCDQTLLNTFHKKGELSHKKVFEWANREGEFVKRAGLAMIAVLAVHDKKADDYKFVAFFDLLKEKSDDNRNFVKKATNWAIRQIGKRNLNLNKKALELSREIDELPYKSAKWVAKDAIRELTDEKILKRLVEKEKKINKNI
jgi:3-methyladenine DNA glycosylase AlkD